MAIDHLCVARAATRVPWAFPVNVQSAILNDGPLVVLACKGTHGITFVLLQGTRLRMCFWGK